MKKPEDSLANTFSRFNDCSLTTLPKQREVHHKGNKTIAPPPTNNCHLGQSPPGKLPPDNYRPPSGQLHPGQFPPRKIAPDNIIIFMMSFDYVIKFVGENFRHLVKILSLFPDEVFLNKITIILPYHSTFV